MLPEPKLADPVANSGDTMRHLLTHTSGIDGDVFTDTGRGDDCLAKYAEVLAGEAQNHPLGATWSYCNSDNQFLIMEPAKGTWLPVTFYDLPTGERYVHHDVRATPKAS